MDPAAKKRKADDNGNISISGDPSSAQLTFDDAKKIIASFSHDQLADIVADAMCRGGESSFVLSSVRLIADRDPVQRKLFIRGLGWETTTEGLRSLFSTYGDLEEAVVITDKNTGRSKGYGFITFRHIDGAMNALREPSKKIDGRMTVTQLAAAGAQGPTAPAIPTVDVSQRKIYVAGVPREMPSDALLAHFSAYGEIEEGPLGFDKQTGVSRGYALFVYKTVEGARAALVDPVKNVLGHQLTCKLADTGKKGRVGGAPDSVHNQQQPGGVGSIPGGGINMPGVDALGSSLPGSMLAGQFGGSGPTAYGGYTGGAIPGAAAAGLGLNSPLQSSMGMGNSGIGVTPGSQLPSSLGGAGGTGSYASGLSGGAYGSASQYSGFPSSGYGGLGMGLSLYNRLQPSSVGLPESGGHLSLSGQSAYQSQLQASGSPPGGPRLPAGGLHSNFPPFY